jgi:transcription initiation factor IIE alpha subunit
VTIKTEEALYMIRNVSISYIKVEESEDGNLHAFEVINTELVPKNMVQRKSKIYKAVKMAAKCFLKHGMSFQQDPTT